MLRGWQWVPREGFSCPGKGARAQGRAPVTKLGAVVSEGAA